MTNEIKHYKRRGRPSVNKYPKDPHNGKKNPMEINTDPVVSLDPVKPINKRPRGRPPGSKTKGMINLVDDWLNEDITDDKDLPPEKKAALTALHEEKKWLSINQSPPKIRKRELHMRREIEKQIKLAVGQRSPKDLQFWLGQLQYYMAKAPAFVKQSYLKLILDQPMIVKIDLDIKTIYDVVDAQLALVQLYAAGKLNHSTFANMQAGLGQLLNMMLAKEELKAQEAVIINQ